MNVNVVAPQLVTFIAMYVAVDVTGRKRNSFVAAVACIPHFLSLLMPKFLPAPLFAALFHKV